jgi:hypothetical protein
MRTAKRSPCPPASFDRAADARHFEAEIGPLLNRHCVECHRGNKPKGNLRLDNLRPDPRFNELLRSVGLE